MLKTKFLTFFEKILLKRFIFYKTIFIIFTFYAVVGCAKKSWVDYGDSCILISDDPPLRRVINYSDHDLCKRKLSPRLAPYPNTRIKSR